MADSADPTRTKRPSSITNDNSLKYAFDAGFLPGEYSLDDTPESIEFESDEGEESDQSSESDTDSKHMADLAASLRVFSESMQKLALAELEMIKERETLRLEAEKRRMELDTQLTQMMMQTQLQITSFACQKSSNLKRKRSDDVNFTARQRNGTVFMGLLQSNLISGLDPTR